MQINFQLNPISPLVLSHFHPLLISCCDSWPSRHGTPSNADGIHDDKPLKKRKRKIKILRHPKFNNCRIIDTVSRLIANLAIKIDRE